MVTAMVVPRLNIFRAIGWLLRLAEGWLEADVAIGQLLQQFNHGLNHRQSC